MSDGLSKFALAAGVAALALSGYVAATAVPADVGGRVDTLERTVAGLAEADVGGLAERVTALEAGSAATIAPEEFGQLTQRVQELAGLVTATSAAQDETVGAVRDRVGDLEETLATLRSETIGGLTARVDRLTEGLASATAGATAMGETLTTVQTGLAAATAAGGILSGEVDALEASVQTLSGRVDGAATAAALEALSAELHALVAGGLVPVGAILPWHPEMADDSGLPQGFVICDGRAIEAGPLAGQTAPDLRDRFLMGGDAAGETGGVREATTGAAGGHGHELGGDVAAGEGAPGGPVTPVEVHTHTVDVTPPYFTVVYVMRVE